MAQIELKLSARTQKETGMREVMIRFVQGWKFNARAKSGIFVSPDYFEYYNIKSYSANCCPIILQVRAQ